MRPLRNRRFFSQDFLFTRSWGNDCMRTTMIGPNYRWRGRARDVLVSPSRRCSHSAILSLFFSLSFLSSLASPLVVRERARGPPMLCTSLRVSWQVYTRIFLLLLLHLLPLPHRVRPLHCAATFASLSTRPHPKEIKPHLTR